MEAQATKRERRAALLAAIMGGLMVVGTLGLLYLFLGDLLLYALAIVGGLVFVGLLHYVTWGRSLLKETAEERARLLAEEAEQEAAAATPWERRF
jgi:predicted lipid-binding transport protein (Tim44 family)